MKELNLAIEQLLIQLHGVWYRRRYIIITAWLICPLGWYVVYKMPPVYEAQARVYFDTQTILEPLLRDLTVTTNSQQQIQALARTVMSRPNLEKVARQADLDIYTATPREFEQLIDRLEKDLKLSYGRGSRTIDNIYTLSFTDKEPRNALNVVQEMMNVFIETRVGVNRADQASAERFLSNQIADYEKRLLEAERKRSEFRRNQMNILSGGETSYYSRINQHEEQLASALLELRELETRLQAAQKELSGLTSIESGRRQPATQYDARITELTTTLDGLLMRYTDSHPDVIETQRLLNRIQQQKDEELALLREAATDSASGVLLTNPVYERLSAVVSELEGAIASRKVRIAAYENTLTELRSKLSLIPGVEAEYAALNRDYDINKANYESLLSRRESADMAMKVTATESEAQFRVIDPPRVPMKPSGPNRIKFYALVLMLGIGGGIAIAYLRNLSAPVLTNPLQLKSISDFPVFGIVSHTNKAAILKQSRLHLIYFGLLTAALLGLFTVLTINEMLFRQ